MIATRHRLALLLATASVAILAAPRLTPLLATASVATPERLGGAERYRIHVSTDKPIYREGETLYGRAVILAASNGKPWPADRYLGGQIEILGPKGETVAQLWSNAQDGVVAFSWVVPAGQAGGLYKARVGAPAPGIARSERAFEVRAYRPPRLKSQIVFLRDGYGPGDDVTATLSVERAEGGKPEGAAVTLVAIVDGSEVARQSAGSVSAAGLCTASFRLPNVIERGEGTLALVIEDGGVVETATKTIPILLQTLDLAIYPEGGELVAGLPARVYIEARTPAGKPADLVGVIETADGKKAGEIRTEHEGRGRARFTPAAGKSYRLRITEPSGIARTFDLPAVQPKGVALMAVDDVTAAGKPVSLELAATAKGVYRLTISKLEKELGLKRVELQAGRSAKVLMDPGSDGDGVLRVTLATDDGAPLAERLVFRQPSHRLLLAVDADRERYVPGGTVELTVHATHEDGSPASAVVGIAVSDDAVHELLETRDQPPRLPVQVLLEDDVRELADAQVYLDYENPDAPRALDLLLGTQGWRRFAFVRVDEFLATHGDAARRVLALLEAMPMATGRGMPKGAMRFAEFEEGMVMGQDEAMPPPPAPAAMPVDLPAPPPEPQQLAPPAIAEPVAKPVMAAKVAANRQAPALEDKKERRAMAEMDAIGYLDQDTVVVREYAHQVRPDRNPTDRVDFTETLLWNAGVRTDDGGKATFRFGLSDAVTTFRVVADAFDAEGSIGAATAKVESVQPFYVEPKLPLEVTYGDVVVLPVAVVNGTREPLRGVTLSVRTGAHLTAQPIADFGLAEEERGRRLVTLGVKEIAGVAKLIVAGHAGGYGDEVTRTLRVAPRGFPTELAFGGMLGAGSKVTHEVAIPDSVVKGSLQTQVQVFPTSLGKLSAALERLIQEPCGCFEQTSSTTYPLVMAQQYFLGHAGVDPALIARSHELLGRGYDRLTGFECKKKGYEWFGEDPGHEALTAFGLLEFTDMAKVRPVDAAMLLRTREWLLGQRDGKGGFKRERRALHTWIEDHDSSNAYILWALLETGATGLDPEVEALVKAADASDNSYVHALAARVMELAGRKADATRLLDRLAKGQQQDGSVGNATASIVGSSGEALTIEATALAAIAWLGSDAHQAQAESAVRFLAASCEGGRYGSTQATVLALRAIVLHDELRSKPKAPGSLRLLVDGQPVGAAVPFDDKTEGAINLPDASGALTPGHHRIELQMERGSEMPYAISVKLNSETPASSPECPLTLELDLPKDRVREGDVVQVTALVRSRAHEALPMAVAIVGLPGGLEPRHEQLKELVKAGTVAAYEVIGREVVLYWRSVAPDAVLRVPLALVAAIPGDYTAPASRAYLYYGDEHKTWVEGFKVSIDPLP